MQRPKTKIGKMYFGDSKFSVTKPQGIWYAVPEMSINQDEAKV